MDRDDPPSFPLDAAPAAFPGPAPLRGMVPWGVLALFLPPAFMGIVALPNEYRSWGGSGVDCDGPLLVTWAVPAAVVHAVDALVFISRVFRHRSPGAGVAAAACLLLVAGLVANVGAARRETKDPDYRLVCQNR